MPIISYGLVVLNLGAVPEWVKWWNATESFHRAGIIFWAFYITNGWALWIIGRNYQGSVKFRVIADMAGRKFYHLFCNICYSFSTRICFYVRQSYCFIRQTRSHPADRRYRPTKAKNCWNEVFKKVSWISAMYKKNIKTKLKRTLTPIFVSLGVLVIWEFVVSAQALKISYWTCEGNFNSPLFGILPPQVCQTLPKIL